MLLSTIPLGPPTSVLDGRQLGRVTFSVTLPRTLLAPGIGTVHLRTASLAMTTVPLTKDLLNVLQAVSDNGTLGEARFQGLF